MEQLGAETAAAKRGRLGTLAVAGAAITFYFVTTCRWIGLGDTALLINDMVSMNISSHVNNHPMSVLVGHIFSKLPVYEIAFRCNLMSAFVGAAAVTVFYLIALDISRSALVSVVSTLPVLVMQSMWWHSTIVENYAFNALFFNLVALLLLRADRTGKELWCRAAFFASGLAVFNHVQMGLLLPVLFVYTLLEGEPRPKGFFSRMRTRAPLYVAGLLPYLALLAHDMYTSGQIKQTLYWAAGGDFQRVMFKFDPFYSPLSVLGTLLMQFPSPMLLVIVLGIVIIFKRRERLRVNAALLAGFCINTFFFMQYNTWDRFAFLLPSFLTLAVYAIFGFRFLYAIATGTSKGLAIVFWPVCLLSAVLPPIIYRAIPAWGANPSGLFHEHFSNHYTENTHDCVKYVTNPDKRTFNDVHEYASLLFSRLPLGSLYLDDDSRTYYPLALYFQRWYQPRPDLQIRMMNSWGFEGWGLTPAQLSKQVATAIANGKPAFVVSTGDPFVPLLTELRAKSISAEKYDLDSTRWIYRLISVERHEPGLAEWKRIFRSIEVGLDLNTDTPDLRDSLRANQAIMARVTFEANGAPISVKFHWTSPDGHSYFTSAPFEIPPGNTSVWSYLERQDERTPGNWTVSLSVEGLPQDTPKHFRIE